MNCNDLRTTPKERLQRISWVKEFYLVRWNDYHSISVFDLLKFHQFGSTVLPEWLLQYVWYVGEGEVWKGTLMVADLEQVDKNRRVRIPQRKAQREGYDLAQIGGNSQKPQVDNENLLEEIRFWELQFWQGTTQVRGEGQEDLLGESDGFPPTTRAGSHCTSTQALHRDQRYPHQNCFKFFFGKTCHELLQQADLRRLLRVKEVAIMVPGLSTTSSLSSLSTPTPPTSSTQDVGGSIPDPASIERESEDRQARGDSSRNPTNQAMSMQESQRTKVESSWQVRWDPLLSIFFEDMMRGDADKDCEQVFNVT